MTTMKAVVVTRYGGSEVLSYEDVPKPSLNEDDVLVRVEAAGVNPGQAEIRQGDFAEYHTLPLSSARGMHERLAQGETHGKIVLTVSE